jgi:uncharacterized membrane protein
VKADRQVKSMTDERQRRAHRLARLLGLASLGLGAGPLTAPDAVSRLSGVDDSRCARAMVRLVGVRELLHAALLLGGRRPAPWVWTRVAGDAMDLTALGVAASNRTRRTRRQVKAVTAAVAGITIVDVYAALRGSRRRGPTERGRTLHAAITVNRPPDEVYRVWRDLENLPRFMIHLESVQSTGDGHSHWRAKSPLRGHVEWDADIVGDRPGELIAWQSTGGAIAGNSGSVRFTEAPGGRGTEVRVELRYSAPGGPAGAAFARLLGEHPEQQVRDDLRRFKQVMETGEVVRSEGSPEGTRALRQFRQRPAQPVTGGGVR